MVRLSNPSSNLLAFAFTLLLAVTLGGPAGSLYAATPQDGEGVTDEGVFLGDLSGSFDRLWRRYQEAEATGQDERRLRILEEIRRLRVERNAFHLHDIAMVFALQGSTHLEQGNLAAAKTSFDTANELDPSLSTPLLGLAQVARQSGGFWLPTYIGYIVNGYLASFRSLWSGYYARADLLIVVTVSTSLALFLFAAMMLYRYAALLDHNFAERFTNKLGPRGVRALTLLVLVLPLILTIGFAWLIPYWLAMTFIHQTRREKALSVVSLLCFLLLGPQLEFHNQWSRTIVNPAFRAALSSDAGTFEATDVFELQSALDRYPDDLDLKLLLAILYKDLGEYELSASLYREILNDDVTDLAAQTNLGNIYFAQRDWEGANFQYTKAIADHPNSAMAYYNKSLAHGESFRFREREAARAQAENLDASAVAAFEQHTGGHRAVADVRLAPDYILAKFFGLEEGLHPSPPRSVQSAVLASARVTAFAVGAVLFAVLTVFIEVAFRDRRNTQRCGTCGGPFCGRCQIGTGRRGLCTQCYHLFIVKDGVSTSARNRKLAQVSSYAANHRLVFRILSVVAPGAGHIAEDTPLLGFPLLLFWTFGAVLLVLLLRGGGLYPNVELALGLGSSLITYLVGAVMLLLLVVANTVAQPRIGA